MFVYEQVKSDAVAGNTEAGRFDDRFYILVGKIDLIYFDRGKLILYGKQRKVNDATFKKLLRG